MAMNTVPPQAYTRETLAAAYEWLKNQPMSIRELANNADTLVSLFLQARRRQTLGQMNASGSLPSGVATHAANVSSSLNTTIPAQQTATEEAHSMATEYYSSDSFKKDLKTLAEGMKQFEGPKPTEIVDRSATQNFSNGHSHATAQSITQTFSQPATQTITPSQSTNTAQTNYTLAQTNYTLDAKTIDILRLVQYRLNLSSDSEALRMLVTLGFEKVREILPK